VGLHFSTEWVCIFGGGMRGRRIPKKATKISVGWHENVKVCLRNTGADRISISTLTFTDMEGAPFKIIFNGTVVDFYQL
jgi:hypothetical protein